ncbi:hypothetical protein GCM10022631_24590 [Deinococcus rubellus]
MRFDGGGGLERPTDPHPEATHPGQGDNPEASFQTVRFRDGGGFESEAPGFYRGEGTLDTPVLSVDVTCRPDLEICHQ